MITQKQIDSSKLPLQNKHIKIEILDYDFKVIDTIEEECIGGSLQKVADDSSYTIRRNGSVQIAIPTLAKTEMFLEKINGYKIQLGGKLWIDKYVKIYIGVVDYLQENEPIVWNSFGICLIDSPSRKYNASQYEITFNVIDLLAKLTGERQGQLTGTATIIKAGVYENVYYEATETAESLKEVLQGLGGIESVSIADMPQRLKYLPYDIKVEVGATVWDIIQQYMQILSTWHIYFDNNGVLIVGPIPSGVNDILFPIVEEQVISSDLNINYNNVKNQVVVYGSPNTVHYLAKKVEYENNIMKLYFDNLYEDTFTINATNFGFVTPNKFNDNEIVQIQMYVDNVLTYSNFVVGFETSSDGISANALHPNEMYFVRIYKSELIYWSGFISNPFGGSWIYSIASDSDNVYCGGYDGKFAIYNKASGTFGSLVSTPFSTSIIYSIASDSDNVYCGGEGGNFAIYNKASGTFGSLVATPFKTSDIRSIANDSDNVYCGGAIGRFAIYNKASGTFGSLVATPFSTSIIYSIANDSYNVYCGGGGGKFAIYNKASGTFGSLVTTPFSTSNIYSIANDSYNVYCSGNLSKFAIYNKISGTFGSLVTTPFLTSIVWSIASDSDNIYLGCNSGRFAIYNKKGKVDMPTAIFEFVGKQQPSSTLVEESKESPFYINAGLPQPNYYCGLSHSLGEEYNLTLNNEQTINELPHNTVITFMSNILNAEDCTISIYDKITNNKIIDNKLLKKNYWVDGDRENIASGILANDYTIYEIQYDKYNDWFVFKGRYGMAFTKVCSGGEYDNIFSDTLAKERCQYELYLHTNLNNNVNMGIVPTYALDVNMKIPYNEDWFEHNFDWGAERPQNENLKNYLVKSVNYPLSVGEQVQTINAMEIYYNYELFAETRAKEYLETVGETVTLYNTKNGILGGIKLKNTSGSDISSDIELKIIGNNLYNINGDVNFGKSEVFPSSTVVDNKLMSTYNTYMSSAYGQLIYLQEGIYTLSCNAVERPTDSRTYLLSVLTEDKTLVFAKEFADNGKHSISFSINESKKYIIALGFEYVTSNNTYTATFENIQLERGATDSNYLPYVSETKTIPLDEVIANLSYPILWERKTISENSNAGSGYSACKFNSTTRIILKELLPIQKLTNISISIADGYSACYAFFNENKKYLGRTNGFITWQMGNYTINKDASYMSIVVKKNDESIITTDDIVAVNIKVDKIKGLQPNKSIEKKEGVWYIGDTIASLSTRNELENIPTYNYSTTYMTDKDIEITTMQLIE